MTMKIGLKMKSRSHRYDINKPRPRNEHTHILNIKYISV